MRVLSVLKFTAVKREEASEDGKAPSKTKEVKAKKPGEEPPCILPGGEKCQDFDAVYASATLHDA